MTMKKILFGFILGIALISCNSNNGKETNCSVSTDSTLVKTTDSLSVENKEIPKDTLKDGNITTSTEEVGGTVDKPA